MSKLYNVVRKFVEKNGILSYKEIIDKGTSGRLSNKTEYIASVVDILIRQEHLFQSPFDENIYCNKRLYKYFSKAIVKNMSSQEIKKKTSKLIGDFSFDEIYKWMYIKVKYLDIDFKRGNEVKVKRAKYGDISDDEFSLLRYPIEEHPIRLESEEIKNAYIGALKIIVDPDNTEPEFWRLKIEEFRHLFDIETINSGINDVKVFSKPIKHKKESSKMVSCDYRCLLLFESLYFKQLINKGELNYKEIEKLIYNLKIHKSLKDFIYRYVRYLYVDGDIKLAEEMINFSIVKKDLVGLSFVHKNIIRNEKYIRMNQYHVAICATMSAGKSTFINALLGKDYIPAKNEACTAKITRIRDNKVIKKTIGQHARNNEHKVYSNRITNEVLDTWNSDPKVNNTVIESNIEGVSCTRGVLVLHDTPGTNNSGDLSHYKTTIDFLKETATNIVMFLINAEQVSTTDSENLIKEIKGIIDERNGKIVFLLNKIDRFDEENGDSLKKTTKMLKIQLENYGFQNPLLIPISAYAGRLFKMVLNGDCLTRREERNFRNLLEYFDVNNQDIFNVIYSHEEINSKWALNEIAQDETVPVSDEEYSHNQIIRALNRTGIPIVEHWLDQQINYK